MRIHSVVIPAQHVVIGTGMGHMAGETGHHVSTGVNHAGRGVGHCGAAYGGLNAVGCVAHVLPTIRYYNIRGMANKGGGYIWTNTVAAAIGQRMEVAVTGGAEATDCVVGR